jgi:hypothetical protein
MDFLSAILLALLNVPVFLLFCGLFRRTFAKDRHDFWKSLLAWSFDPHAFFEKGSLPNHLAVAFLSLSVVCCVLLVLCEYEWACRLVDGLRAFQPLRLLTRS